jgi:hypothetical protein
LPGVLALHEPQPWYGDFLNDIRKNPERAAEYVRERKWPALKLLPYACTYVEASHYICKGYLDAWLEMNLPIDLLIQERDARKVALSWLSLGVGQKGNTPQDYQHILHPADPRARFLPIRDWQKLHPYQITYWYALEIEQRANHYERVFKEQGRRTLRTSTQNIKTEQGLKTLLEWLDIALTPELLEQALKRSQRVVDGISSTKQPERAKEAETLDLDVLETEVKSLCEWP